MGEEDAVEAVKGCPFCGSVPAVRPSRPDVEGTCWAMVVCQAEECPSNPSVTDGIHVSDGRGSDAYKAAAIERWNRRAM